jgi:plasmid stabilization system protein ParE
MAGERFDGEGTGEGTRRKRGSLFGWLAKRLIISFAVMSLISLAGLGYMAHRNRMLVEDALRGLDAIADRLDGSDKDSAAEELRKLRTKLESLRETSGGYSERAKRALERIRRGSEDLYLDAKRAIDGDSDGGGTSADAPTASPPANEPALK